MVEKLSSDYDFNFLDWPFYWLAKADRAYLAKLEIALSHVGLDIPRWRVLMVLHSRSKASVSELADHSIVKLSTMTKIVQRMEVDHLVSSAPNKKDGRVTDITITEKGEQAGQHAWKEANEIMQGAFDGFRKRDQQTLMNLLRKLAENLST